MYVLSIQKRKEGRVMNSWRILEGSEDGFMTAILHTNTLRELKVLQKREFQGKKKSEGSTGHCKSWRLLRVKWPVGLVHYGSKCSIPSAATLPRFQSGERSRAAFSCSAHIQQLIRNCWSVCGLHACVQGGISEVNSGLSFSFCPACFHVAQNWPWFAASPYQEGVQKCAK